MWRSLFLVGLQACVCINGWKLDRRNFVRTSYRASVAFILSRLCDVDYYYIHIHTLKFTINDEPPIVYHTLTQTKNNIQLYFDTCSCSQIHFLGHSNDIILNCFRYTIFDFQCSQPENELLQINIASDCAHIYSFLIQKKKKKKIENLPDLIWHFKNVHVASMPRNDVIQKRLM